MDLKKLSVVLSPVHSASGKNNSVNQSKQKIKLKRLHINLVSSGNTLLNNKTGVIVSAAEKKKKSVMPLSISLPRLSPAEVKKYRYRSSVTEVEDNMEKLAELEKNNGLLILPNNKTIKHSSLKVSKSKQIGNNKMDITLSKLEKKEMRGVFSNTSSISQLCVSLTSAFKKRTFRAYTTQTLTEHAEEACSSDFGVQGGCNLAIQKPVIMLSRVDSQMREASKECLSRQSQNEAIFPETCDKVKEPTCRRRSLRVLTSKKHKQEMNEKQSIYTNKDLASLSSEGNLSVSLTELSNEEKMSALVPVVRRNIDVSEKNPVCKTFLSVALTSISPKEINEKKFSSQRNVQKKQSGKRRGRPKKKNMQTGKKRGRPKKSAYDRKTKTVYTDVSDDHIAIQVAKATTQVTNEKYGLNPLRVRLSNLSPKEITEATGTCHTLGSEMKAGHESVRAHEKQVGKSICNNPTAIKRKKTVVIEVFDSAIAQVYNPDDDWQPRRSKRLALMNKATSSKSQIKSAPAKLVKDTNSSRVNDSGASKRKKNIPVRRKLDFEQETPLLYSKPKKKRKSFGYFEYLSSPENKLKATFKRIKKSGSEHQAYVKGLNISLERLSEGNSETSSREENICEVPYRKKQKETGCKVRENVFDKFSTEKEQNFNEHRTVLSNDDQTDNVSVSSTNTVKLVLNQDFDVHSSETGITKVSSTCSRKRRSVRNKMKVLEERKKRNAEQKINLANQMSAFLQAIDDLEVLSDDTESSAQKKTTDVNRYSTDHDEIDGTPAVTESTITRDTMETKRDMVEDIINVVHGTESEPETNNISDIIANFLKPDPDSTVKKGKDDYIVDNPKIPLNSTVNESQEIRFPSDEYIEETPQVNRYKVRTENNNFLLGSPVIPVAAAKKQTYIDPSSIDDLNSINKNDLVNDDLFLNSENAMNDILETIMNGHHADLMQSSELDLMCESDTDV